VFYISKQKLYNIVFAVALVLTVGINFFPSYDIMETAAPPVHGKVVVIDAGHGSPDGGAVGISGVLEKDLNLDVAKMVGNFLEQSGAFVIYTRYDDNSVAENLGESIREIKRKDLKKRKDIKNNSGADIFVSIHMNKFDDAKYKGAQVFYANSSQESKLLAESIQKSIRNFADSTNTREIKEDNNSIFILRDNTIPSVVVECGFLSNLEEEKKLNTKKYRETIAFAIFSGISEYASAK